MKIASYSEYLNENTLNESTIFKKPNTLANVEYNLTLLNCKSNNQLQYKINDDLTVDLLTSAKWTNQPFKKIPVKFNRADFSFIWENGKLTTLEGCPRSIGGEFSCYKNNLKTLEGGPLNVEGTYNCSTNKLTNVKNLPEYWKTTKRCNGNLDLSNNYLTSLEGCPENVSQWFDCNINMLKTLEFGPKNVRTSYDCKHNSLTSLNGCATDIGNEFNCGDNKLTNLNYFPKHIGGMITIGSNPLTDVSDVPIEIIANNFIVGSREIRTAFCSTVGKYLDENPSNAKILKNWYEKMKTDNMPEWFEEKYGWLFELIQY